MKAPPRKRPTTQTESRDIVDHEPKRARLSPPETLITKEDEYDWDNDPEIPELRERFRKIKYDINYPLPKKPALRKEKAPPPKSKIKEPDHRRGVKRKSSLEKPLHKKKGQMVAKSGNLISRIPEKEQNTGNQKLSVNYVTRF